MAISRALNAGVSGLRAFQTKMDVIGNNIANVETAGFKSSRVTFSELLSQRVGRSAGGDSSPQATNQVGLGVLVASVDRNFGQGVLQNTGRTTDLALEGKGFFMVNNNGQSLYTRAGNFAFNKDGFLVDQGGRTVQGYNTIGDDQLQLGVTQDIKIDFENLSLPKATNQVMLAGNLNSNAEEGDEKVMSSTVYDSKGKAHSLVLTFKKMANDNEWNLTGKLNGVEITGFTETITFDDKGVMSNPPLDPVKKFSEISIPSITIPNAGAEPLDLKLNLGDGVTNFTQYAGADTGKVFTQDGFTQGQLIDLRIGGDGKIQGVYDNGRTSVLAQLALATVQNENGLEMIGEGLFVNSASAGEVFISTADQMSGTKINSGNLEGSNVELAKEFTEMITTQRAYQSSARVISTADEMLVEAVNLKR
jgi:flagellar hook protein FlgE